jgi:hypothetical protein
MMSEPGIGNREQSGTSFFAAWTMGEWWTLCGCFIRQWTSSAICEGEREEAFGVEIGGGVDAARFRSFLLGAVGEN